MQRRVVVLLQFVLLGIGTQRSWNMFFTSILHGLIRTHKWPVSNVSGFIALYVALTSWLERRTGIARSRVQTPLKSWLFQTSIRNCVHNCDDHSLLDTTTTTPTNNGIQQEAPGSRTTRPVHPLDEESGVAPMCLPMHIKDIEVWYLLRKKWL